MSDQQLYAIPVTPPIRPLKFEVRPVDDKQPYILCSCGHKQWQLEEIVLDGQVVSTTKLNFSHALARLPQMLLHRLPHPKRCLLCEFAEQFSVAVRCSFCHAPIYRGERVSIWRPEDKGIEDFDPELATAIADGSGRYMGCDRRDCCPEIFFLAGTWSGEEILTPYQHGRLMEAAFAGESGPGMVKL